MLLLGKPVKFFIRAYQLLLSPVLGVNCRFTPSCSCYALEAIEKHGTCKGTYFALHRLCRCHPFAKPGYDPVPTINSKSKA